MDSWEIEELLFINNKSENRNQEITNSYIMLTPTPLSNAFTYSNDKASKSWIKPIGFTGKGNSSLFWNIPYRIYRI